MKRENGKVEKQRDQKLDFICGRFHKSTSLLKIQIQ